MKKILSVFTAMILAVSFSSCGSNPENPTSDSETNSAETADTENGSEAQNDPANSSENSDVLIVYFSETGNTQLLAELIHEQTGGDMFRIEPVTPYPQGDELFDYTKAEQDNDERPEISGTVENIGQYDTVFIGYPIWWYEVPQIIKTFLDDYDLSGKTIVPFNTHEGSRDGGTYDYIAEQEPDATVLEGLPIRGGDMKNDQSETVKSWLEGLDLE